VWKSLKLLTLVVLTMFLAWKTYPIWSELKDSHAEVAWTSPAGIRAYTSLGGNVQLEVSLEARTYTRETNSSQIGHEPIAQLGIRMIGLDESRAPELTTSRPSSYVEAAGSASRLFEDCQTEHGQPPQELVGDLRPPEPPPSTVGRIGFDEFGVTSRGTERPPRRYYRLDRYIFCIISSRFGPPVQTL
jgi:hypothetical protein